VILWPGSTFDLDDRFSGQPFEGDVVKVSHDGQVIPGKM